MSGVAPTSGIDAAFRALEFAYRAASLAQQASEHAARNAELHERMTTSRSAAADVHARLAAVHRRNERRQRAAEAMHEAFASRLENWLTRHLDDGAQLPRLMSAVASTVGWQGAVLTLYNHHGVERLVAASDPAARRAHQLEAILAEGPSWDAARGRESTEDENVLRSHWPRYASAVARLGVRSVAAVSLDLREDDLRGSLTVTGTSPPVVASRAYGLHDVADALSRTVLCVPGLVRAGNPDLPGLEMFEDDDYQPALHQAAGVLHERCGWSIDDALALVRAHAYAEDRPVEQVADEVIQGALLLK